MFRPRLYQIENKEELIKYFSKHAGFVQKGIYEVAGIMASDTRELYKKLILEWEKDVLIHNGEMIIHAKKNYWGNE